MRKHLKTYANAYDVNWSLLEMAYKNVLGEKLYYNLKSEGKILS